MRDTRRTLGPLTGTVAADIDTFILVEGSGVYPDAFSEDHLIR